MKWLFTQISVGSMSPMFEVTLLVVSWPEAAWSPQTIQWVSLPPPFSLTRSCEPPSRPIAETPLNLILMSNCLPMPALRQHVPMSELPQTTAAQRFEPAPGTWSFFAPHAIVVQRASCSSRHFSSPCFGQSFPKAPTSAPHLHSFRWQAAALPRPLLPHHRPSWLVQFSWARFSCVCASWLRKLSTSLRAFRMSPVSQPFRRLLFSASVSRSPRRSMKTAFQVSHISCMIPGGAHVQMPMQSPSKRSMTFQYAFVCQSRLVLHAVGVPPLMPPFHSCWMSSTPSFVA
mmetsp:Transcript_14502/g.45588  ORF Transcript_14502/g.45588 Transcript_14502/m.45588 type:complete len:287 (+) Transcript_14502:453-1313(+)